ncbi:hypothetical protein NMY22_g10004 [Coprinellus aureogranulatus]|nr:hypothetical protein NMY22_g10004 [Coprinellus aureogranulatus]
MSSTNSPTADLESAWLAVEPKLFEFLEGAEDAAGYWARVGHCPEHRAFMDALGKVPKAFRTPWLHHTPTANLLVKENNVQFKDGKTTGFFAYMGKVSACVDCFFLA